MYMKITMHSPLTYTQGWKEYSKCLHRSTATSEIPNPSKSSG
uniref:Uncharacterized protein n=1 Tax=Anguilla anguilla TaxID=7936 RepID=A0A0E9V7G7_ANGAN